jgi:hypothetical protein
VRCGRKTGAAQASEWSSPPALFTVRHDTEPADDVGGWRITDGNGDVVVAGMDSRHQAVRLMASYAAKRPLPLCVEDASGRPTGDRLG